MKKPKYADGQMIVGYRFRWITEEDLPKPPVRGGLGETFVIEYMPCAGPIVYMQLEVGGVAQCRGCRKTSKIAKRSDVARSWAHKHRCESGSRLDERINLLLDIAGDY